MSGSPATEDDPTAPSVDSSTRRPAYGTAGRRGVEYRVREEVALTALRQRLRSGDRVLELGCGTGSASIQLAREGYKVVALDVSTHKVRTTERNAELAGVRIDVHKGDVHSVLGDQFDAVVALGVAEYVDNLDDLLAGIRDRLRPGGVVALSFTNRLSPFRWLESPIKRALAALVYLAVRDGRWWQIAFEAGASHRPSTVRQSMERCGLAPARFTYLGYGLRFGSWWVPPGGGSIVRPEGEPRAELGRMFVCVADGSSDEGVSPISPAGLPALERLHKDAFAGSMGVALGPLYRKVFLREFVESDDRCAFGFRRDGRLVGYVLGAPVGALTFGVELGAAAAVGLLCRPTLLGRPDIRGELGRRLRRQVAEEPEPPSLEGPTFALVGIGVVEWARASGAADALIEAFEDFAATRGYRSVSLTVYRSNLRARAFYERHGWEQFDHPSNPDVLVYGRNLSASRP